MRRKESCEKMAPLLVGLLCVAFSSALATRRPEAPKVVPGPDGHAVYTIQLRSSRGLCLHLNDGVNAASWQRCATGHPSSLFQWNVVDGTLAHGSRGDTCLQNSGSAGDPIATAPCSSSGSSGSNTANRPIHWTWVPVVGPKAGAGRFETGKNGLCLGSDRSNPAVAVTVSCEDAVSALAMTADTVSSDPLFPATSVVGLKLRQAGGPGPYWCLDTAGRAARGMQAVLGDCKSSTTTFAWNPISGRLKGGEGLCVIVGGEDDREEGGKGGKGSYLTLGDCATAASTDVAFSFVPAQTQTQQQGEAGSMLGMLRAAGGDWCADGVESGGRVGDSVVMWTCGNGPETLWHADLSVSPAAAGALAAAEEDKENGGTGRMPSMAAAAAAAAGGGKAAAAQKLAANAKAVRDAKELWGPHGPCAAGPSYWCANVRQMKECGVDQRQCPLLGPSTDDPLREPKEGRAGFKTAALKRELTGFHEELKEETREVRRDARAAAAAQEAARLLAFREKRSSEADMLQRITAADRADGANGGLRAVAAKIGEEEVRDASQVDAAVDADMRKIHQAEAEQERKILGDGSAGEGGFVPAAGRAPTSSEGTMHFKEELPEAVAADPVAAPEKPEDEMLLAAAAKSGANITASENKTAECAEEAKMRKQQARELLGMAKQVMLLKKDVDRAKEKLQNASKAYNALKVKVLDHLSQAHTSSVGAYEAHETKGPGVETRLDAVKASAEAALAEQKALIAEKAKLRPLMKALEEATAKWQAAQKHLKDEADAQLRAAERKVADLAKVIAKNQDMLDGRIKESIQDATFARDVTASPGGSLKHFEAAFRTAIASSKAVENAQYYVKELLRRKDMAEAAVRAVKRIQGRKVFEETKKGGNDLLSDKEMSELQASVEAATQAANAARATRDGKSEPALL